MNVLLQNTRLQIGWATNGLYAMSVGGDYNTYPINVIVIIAWSAEYLYKTASKNTQTDVTRDPVQSINNTDVLAPRPLQGAATWWVYAVNVIISQPVSVYNVKVPLKRLQQFARKGRFTLATKIIQFWQNRPNWVEHVQLWRQWVTALFGLVFADSETFAES